MSIVINPEAIYPEEDDTCSVGYSALRFSKGYFKETVEVGNPSQDQHALNLGYANTLFETVVTAGDETQYYRGDKTWQTLDKTAVGLTNVDDAQQIPLDYLDVDPNMFYDSDTRVPSQKAVRTYIDAQIAAISSTQIVTDEDLSSQLDGSTTVFTIANTIVKPVMLNLNGGLLIYNVHYTVSGTTLTLIGKYAEVGNIPESGEELYFTYFQV